MVLSVMKAATNIDYSALACITLKWNNKCRNATLPFVHSNGLKTKLKISTNQTKKLKKTTFNLMAVSVY